MANRLLIVGAVVLSLPCGWGLGLLVAYLVAGKNFGQLPAATVSLGLIGAVAFALWSRLTAKTRFMVTLAGSVVVTVGAWLAR
jgi:hypothetical protein